MMKNRFIKFIRVYWKGILLYAAIVLALLSSLALFMYFGGTSFLAWKDFTEKA